MWHRGDLEKVSREEASIREYLHEHHPKEELRGYMHGMERPSMWLEALLLGPIVGTIASCSYYIGLTGRRIVLVHLSNWTGKPTKEVSEILLDENARMEYNKGWLNGSVKIHYGNDTKRKFVFNFRQRQAAKDFVEAFEFLPKRALTEAERIEASALEEAYRQEAKSRIGTAILVLVALVILAFLCSYSGRY